MPLSFNLGAILLVLNIVFFQWSLSCRKISDHLIYKESEIGLDFEEPG